MTDLRERSWRIRMGDRIWWLEADDYEHAVALFEATLIAEGVERRGAEFMTTKQVHEGKVLGTYAP